MGDRPLTLRYPSVTGRTAEEKIESLRKELIRMTDELNLLELPETGETDGLRLGAEGRASVRLLRENGRELLWIGGADMACGLLLDLTAGTYQLRGRPA